MENETLDNQLIMDALVCILDILRSMEERIDCIQHTICKNDDNKTRESIGKFLMSDFRNIK